MKRAKGKEFIRVPLDSFTILPNAIRVGLFSSSRWLIVASDWRVQESTIDTSGYIELQNGLVSVSVEFLTGG